MATRVGDDSKDGGLPRAQSELEERRKRLGPRDALDIPPMSSALRAVVDDIVQLRQGRDRREQWILDNLRPEAIENVLRDYGIGPRLRLLGIDDELIPERCRRFLETAEQGGNLILAGPPGSGKTTAAVCCLRRLYVARISRGEGAARARYVKLPDLYRKVFENDRAAIVQAECADVLVLDDWGAQYEHAWPLAELDAVIDRRWEAMRPTIVTTNMSPEAGESSIRALLPRSYDRLTGHPGPGVAVLDRASLRQRDRAQR